MKSLLASLLLFGSLTTPILANPSSYFSNSNISRQSQTNIQSDTLLVNFAQPMAIDVGKGDRPTVTTFLAQEIVLSSGNVIPPNTPVIVTIQPKGDGAVLVADAIVISGRKIPIKAVSQQIPSRTITNLRNEDVAKRKGAAIGNFFSSLGGVIGVNVETQQRMANGGAALGILTGMTSPENYRIVEITAGTPYYLEIQSLDIQPLNVQPLNVQAVEVQSSDNREQLEPLW